DYYFRPNESIMSRLLQFDDLQAVSMVLEANWIGKLMMMFMDSKKCILPEQSILGTGEWRVSIDRSLTYTMIKQQILQAQYIVSTEDEESHARITRTSDGMSVELYVEDLVDVRLLNILLVKFNIY
ncbi:hypothetical protein PMAYCL1PPCAC_20334, partial [Pristionchus mayeri]